MTQQLIPWLFFLALTGAIFVSNRLCLIESHARQRVHQPG